MTSDVVLTAALRNNLLSLQNTQSSIDTTQFRLATGRKINSALDGPQAFFAAQALNNRASDLTRLLDGIGQSIQVIKAADNGITALTRLVEQAESIAQSARDALAGGQAEAKVVGEKDLSGVDNLASLAGWGAGAALTFTVTDEDGTVINIDTFGAGSAGTTEAVSVAANTSTEDLIVSINNIVRTSDNAHVLEASLDESGQLQIRTLNGGNLNVNFTTTANTDVANLGFAQSLGFGNKARIVLDQGVGTNNVELTAISDVALKSFALYDSTTTPDTIANRSDLLSNLVKSDGTVLFNNINGATDVYTIGINGGTAQQIALFQNGGTITLQEFIDGINTNTTLNTKIQAVYDDDTGVLSIDVIDASVTDIQIGVVDNNQTVTANFGFGTTTIGANATDANQENIVLASAAAELAQYETDYNNIREQIDLLVADTGYRGTNLLNGDNLTTYFNEDRSSYLETEGTTFTADGLGLDEANFSRAASIDDSLTQVRDALSSVRTFGTTLATNLSVIQTRESFTKELINTLTEGSDKLTIADQNEEGAKLLALQTRQQLGVTSLSLASQSQQSILRLF